MVDVPDALLEEIAGPVAAAIPRVVARIPKEPAAALGRLRATADGTWPIRESIPGHQTGGWSSSGPGNSPVRNALGSLPPLLVERLLGALELTEPELDLAGVPDLSGLLGEPFSGQFGMGITDGTSEAVHGAAMLDQIRPGAVPLVATLARRLAAHQRVAVLLAVEPEVTDELEVAASHGAAHLALAVSTAAAVLHRVGVHPQVTRPPAVLGVAIGTAGLLLRETSMPSGYAAAVLARFRAEYRLPLGSSGRAPVSGHRFAMLEEGTAPEVDFSGNGLVAVVPGGAVIRTGIENGHVGFVLHVLDGPPPDVATGWEEIVEVSWRAAVGGASVAGLQANGPRVRGVTPPWPGDYRLRVHARGRDCADETEYYELVVWQAPAAPDIVHAWSDRLGHRLRGEPEPVRPESPEAAYRWLRRSSLSDAATVTVVTGADVADVLRAFNADPAQPESLRTIVAELLERQSIDPWVAVLDVGGAVLAVEYNGWQGSTEPVLARASADGRAASMYWNIDAVTRLSFAEHGEVLLSEEPFGALDAPPPVAGALADLDFADYRRSTDMMGLVAVQRFTGHGITADDLARIEAADIAFRIVPDLPTLHPHRPHRPQPGTPLAPAAEALTGQPEPTLRALAWWAAAQAANYAGLGKDADIAASITARALTPDAHMRARRSQLSDGEHRWVWLALHHATNPDPLAAALETLDAARYAAGPHAADLLTNFQSRISTPEPP
ncbi:hypothetical protein HUT06_01265 [Actinomadura sp. NAK00032]|uniref:DUF6461 domain-containing protein n=1 Tax=Actinomadura sp. NAK00032 TaxID=2742128 RepID=UPI0015914670|nr:DUF6461 domain-containing protein [Actinomadura sp. NAK00032]QKW32832.1 hypothetical protein HUT06_01265 [Actinomadura sp. NAK00032]